MVLVSGGVSNHANEEGCYRARQPTSRSQLPVLVPDAHLTRAHAQIGIVMGMAARW